MTTPGHAIGYYIAEFLLATEQQTMATAARGTTEPWGMKNAHEESISCCPVPQQLRQCENRDERKSLAFVFVGVRLLDWCGSEGVEKATKYG